MKRRELALTLIVQLLLAAALAGYLSWRQRAAAPLHDAEVAVVETKGVAGYITVIVDGETVYRGEMHSFTEWGAQFLSTIMSRYTYSGGYRQYIPSTTQNPWQMRVGHSLGYSDSSLGKSYGYNSTHMWFSFTGSFTADSGLTLKWVSLIYYDADGELHVISNDTLPNVQVPQGSVYSVVIAIYWRDYGALTENFAKHFWIITPESSSLYVDVVDRSGSVKSLQLVSVGSEEPWSVDYTRHLYPRMYLIVSNRSNPPPPSRSDYDMPEVARYTLSYTLTDKGVVFSATVGTRATEVGLVVRAFSGFGFYREEVEFLVLRWVPPQPLEPGTTVRIYLVPP
ncbi:MAG: hypothetical protein QW498_08465 [Thermofilum sp.]